MALLPPGPLGVELRRQEEILKRFGASLALQPGATDEEIATVEKATKVRFDEELRQLYKFSNGGKYAETWFVIKTDDLAPFRFCPLKEVLQVQSWHVEADIPEPEYGNGDVPWDERIQKCHVNPRWLPIADFGNGNAWAYFDGDPTPAGKHGQIVTYQHDPDAIRYFASSVSDFVRRSNDLMEKAGRDFYDGKY